MEIQPQRFQQIAIALKNNINKVIVGKSIPINQLIIALSANGHVLIEDVPGIGKTTLVSALARSLDLSFKRIQFTPDLMPSDITGFNYYNPKNGEFIFQEGLVMSHLVLADEINRTSPKTQSALLEVMQEQQVSVDGQTIQIPDPFMVLATQNPIENVGTYPLPEAQLDRFMLRLVLDYPTFDEEMDILDIEDANDLLDTIQPIASINDVMWMRKQVSLVEVDQKVKKYIVDFVNATRKHPDLIVGASPRAAQALLKASKAQALISGRDYVIPDDVMRLIPSLLGHRLSIKPEKKIQAQNINTILSDLIRTVRL